MKRNIPKFLLPVGLVLIICTFFIKHFIVVTVPADNFLKAMGFGMVLASLLAGVKADAKKES